MQITLQHIHVTFEGKAKWFYWKIFCKEPPRVNQILHQVQSHMYTQKIAAIFDHIKSHNGQALNHRRLIRPGKKSGRILCVRQVYFTKSCQQIWVSENQPFYHLYITSEVKQCYEELFLSYRPLTECSISQFCNTNYTRSIFRTIEARLGFLAKPFK